MTSPVIVPSAQLARIAQQNAAAMGDELNGLTEQQLKERIVQISRQYKDLQQAAEDRKNDLPSGDHLPDGVAAWTQDHWKEWSDLANKHELYAFKFCQVHKGRIGSCSGAELLEVRQWLRNIRSFVNRIPKQWHKFASIYVGVVITLTATEALARAYDRAIQVNAYKQDIRAFQPGMVLDHLSAEFLGKDEKEKLRDELSKVVQTTSEDVSSYTRRFQEAVEMAYGPAPTNTEAEEMVAQFTLGLKDKRIQTKLFDKDVRNDFKAVILHACEEDAKWQHKDRITRKFRGAVSNRKEEPMDISSVEGGVPLRERLAEKDKELRELRQELSAVKNRIMQNQKSAAKTSSGSEQKCFFCQAPGHFKRDCRKWKARKDKHQQRNVSGN